jgi:uncharacterized membrane protein
MWLLYALSGPVCWAASTHIDKYLVEKYFKGAPTAVLMVFTAIIGLLMLPFIWWLVPGVFTLPSVAVAVMMASGVLYMGAMLFYLQALQGEEASVVAPLFQTSVLWGALLAYLFLGETLTPLEFVGAALIVGGALILSLDASWSFRRIKGRFILLMLACTFVLALSSVIFKFFAVNGDYWSTTFWTYAGEALFGAALLLVPAYFKQFVSLMRTNTGPMLGVNAANELINLGGSLGVRYALLLAPVALVQALSSTTTLLIFFFGVLLTLVAPSLGREDLSRKNLLQKGAAALCVAAGVWLINL